MSHHDQAADPTTAGLATPASPAHGGTMRVPADTLLDGLDAIVWEMDPRTERFTFVSAGAERVLGFPAARWVDEPGFWHAQLHPDDRARGVHLAQRGEDDAGAHELGYRMIAADGRTIWLRDLARVMCDGAGGRLLHGVTIDVTRQKMLERELRASEERFQRLSNASVDGVIVHERGRIVDANATAESMLGYGPGELIGLSPIDLTIPEERPILLAHMRSGSEATLEGTGLAKDGRTLPVEMRARTVYTADGHARVAIVRDISDRRRAEEEIRAGETRLRMLMQQMPALLWTTDRELRATSVLGRGLEAYGIAHPGQVVGNHFPTLFSGHPDQEALVKAHESALAGRAATYTVNWRDVRWEAHVEPLRDAAGEIQGIIGLGIDVSERERAEATLRETERQLQQSQRLEAVGRLAGGIAHDFNNLLTVITGFTQMVLEELAPAHPHASDLREVQRAAMRAAELTRQLLAFSRRQVLRPVVLDVDHVVGELERMLRRVIGEQVELCTERASDTAPDVAPRIRADRSQIEQVVMNLVVNARDAMPDGGTITIRTALVDVDASFGPREVGTEVAPGRYVRLDVADTGIGMPASVRAHIFEPFFTTKPIGTGTGLGLPMAYGVVQQSGGHITVDTAPGRGSTFSLFFPYAEDVTERAPEPAASRPHRGAETVLLVEDEDAVRDVARRILASHGYVVIAARHATEALALAAANPGRIDLLLTDLVMPGLGGRALAERLRAEQPSLRVLFMTGYTDEPAHRTAGAGATLVLKPFTIESLTDAVRASLDGGEA
jgi:two-component system, cell cycle sensor histidine kinase and response regulator CckA